MKVFFSGSLKKVLFSFESLISLSCNHHRGFPRDNWRSVFNLLDLLDLLTLLALLALLALLLKGHCDDVFVTNGPVDFDLHVWCAWRTSLRTRRTSTSSWSSAPIRRILSSWSARSASSSQTPHDDDTCCKFSIQCVICTSAISFTGIWSSAIFSLARESLMSVIDRIL